MRRHGFTLIEVLIVIVILAILAAIVLPRFFIPSRADKEATLSARLGEVRSGIELFKEHCGDYPAELADLLKPTEEPPKEGGNGEEIKASDYQGPYLIGDKHYPHLLPSNPISRGNTEGEDWIYDKTTGEVHPKSGTTIDGSDYSTW